MSDKWPWYDAFRAVGQLTKGMVTLKLGSWATYAIIFLEKQVQVFTFEKLIDLKIHHISVCLVLL